jgi:hypothetical protein
MKGRLLIARAVADLLDRAQTGDDDAAAWTCRNS